MKPETIICKNCKAVKIGNHNFRKQPYDPDPSYLSKGGCDSCDSEMIAKNNQRMMMVRSDHSTA